MPFVRMGMECPWCGEQSSNLMGNPQVATPEEESIFAYTESPDGKPNLYFVCRNPKCQKAFSLRLRRFIPNGRQLADVVRHLLENTTPKDQTHRFFQGSSQVVGVPPTENLADSLRFTVEKMSEYINQLEAENAQLKLKLKN